MAVPADRAPMTSAVSSELRHMGVPGRVPDWRHSQLAQQPCWGRMKRLSVQTSAMASKALVVIAALTALAWPAEVVPQGVSATVLSIVDGEVIRTA